MKTRNDPVGKSECPIKGCTETVPVFKYREHSADATKRRFAGRLYCVCPVHKRVEEQEFLLEHIQWSKGSGGDAPPPAKPPEKPAPRPASPPVSKAANPPAPPPEPPAKNKGGWLPDFFGSESE